VLFTVWITGSLGREIDRRIVDGAPLKHRLDAIEAAIDDHHARLRRLNGRVAQMRPPRRENGAADDSEGEETDDDLRQLLRLQASPPAKPQ